MDDAFKIVQSVGFPIFVSIFFLLKWQKSEDVHGKYIETLTKMNSAIEAMTAKLAELCERVQG